ncbi:Putative LOC100205425, partial [Caligus rogercresseyi]
NNQTTKTVLTFMIKSAGNNYMDVVALIPVSKMKFEFLLSQYTPIMKTLYQIGFIVVAVSVDKHRVNRNFFTNLLCDGELKTVIPHPHDGAKKVHLLFDPVHNFKNIITVFRDENTSTSPES